MNNSKVDGFSYIDNGSTIGNFRLGIDSSVENLSVWLLRIRIDMTVSVWVSVPIACLIHNFLAAALVGISLKELSQTEHYCITILHINSFSSSMK